MARRQSADELDPVFRALADPSRRRLLDALQQRDGRTLTELERALPGLTRFGVMRHLGVLEAAGLVTTRRSGRFKLHYLNPVPIRLIHDRWIHSYQEALVGTLAEIKTTLEKSAAGTTRHVYQVYIRTTPEALWRALTDPDQTRRYWYGACNRSDWQPGSRWTSESDDGATTYLEGTILEVDPPRRLVQTFRVLEDPAEDEAPSRLTFEIEQLGEACRLTVTHEDVGPETANYIEGGWETILSGLKTVLETGEELHIGEPEVAPASAD